MKLDILFDWIDNLVKQSNAANAKLYNGGTLGKWKYCVALEKLGWRFLGYEKILDDRHDAVMARWKKEDREIKFKLGFSDQCAWIEYQLRQEKNE